MANIGYFSPGSGPSTGWYSKVDDPSDSDAANRRVALRDPTVGVLWVCCEEQGTYVKFGGDDVEAAGTGQKDEWYIPAGPGLAISTGGQTHVSVKGAAANVVHLQEVR